MPEPSVCLVSSNLDPVCCLVSRTSEPPSLIDEGSPLRLIREPLSLTPASRSMIYDLLPPVARPSFPIFQKLKNGASLQGSWIPLGGLLVSLNV